MCRWCAIPGYGCKDDFDATLALWEERLRAAASDLGLENVERGTLISDMHISRHASVRHLMKVMHRVHSEMPKYAAAKVKRFPAHPSSAGLAPMLTAPRHPAVSTPHTN